MEFAVLFHIRKTPLLAVCAAAALGIPLSEPALAGDIYGNLAIRDYDSGKTRPLDRRVKIVVETDTRRVGTISARNATYYLTIPEEGRFAIHVYYLGRELTAEIGSYYRPNRNDLVIERRDDEYRLRVEFSREWRMRPEDKDR